MRKAIALAALILATTALPALAKSQGEFVLQAVPEQRFIVQYGTQFLAPAVQLGNSIFVGYVDEGMPTFDQCAVFYYVQAEQEIPVDAVYFLGVVVGSGNNRGYLWTREPLSPKECPGWVPPAGGPGGRRRP